MPTQTDWSEEFKDLVAIQFPHVTSNADFAKKLKHICLGKGLDPLEWRCAIEQAAKYGKENVRRGQRSRAAQMCASQLAGSETLWFDSEGNGLRSG